MTTRQKPVDGTCRQVQSFCVQACSRATHVNEISKSESFAGHVVSCEDERLHWRASTATFRRFTPVSFRRLAGGFFFYLNRADCVKAGCSLICHDILVPGAVAGDYSRSIGRNNGYDSTQNRIARKGAGSGRGTAEKPAHELSVNEAHTRSNAKAGQTPAVDGAGRRRNATESTTSREQQIKGQAVQMRARAVGRKSHPKGRCISSHADAGNGSRKVQAHGGRVPMWAT